MEAIKKFIFTVISGNTFYYYYHMKTIYFSQQKYYYRAAFVINLRLQLWEILFNWISCCSNNHLPGSGTHCIQHFSSNYTEATRI